MLLINVMQWLGTGKRMTDEEKSRCISTLKPLTFATNLSLEDALRELVHYKLKYNEFYLLELDFTLQSVSSIDEVSRSVLSGMGVDLIELLNNEW
jgi:hypothetical protein